MNELLFVLISKYNYWGYIILMMVGLYAMIVKKNLVKKIIGMSILQTAIIFFYISIGVKKNATIPTIMHAHEGTGDVIRAVDYLNPLPHVLMLTAIVVAVATLGVALALAVKIYRHYDTLEEDEIHDLLKRRAE
jgi:multicomponent Na+:H+ antiporter subunit C